MNPINFTLLAQNSEYDYVKQAYLCALSIRASNPNSKIALITNDSVSQKQQKMFDDIIAIPWNDQATGSDWKVENRWKIYHATPYEKTIVLDTDMLVLDDITHWWNFLHNKKLFFTTNVINYRGEPVTSNYYRKVFEKYQFPNLYSGFHYFEKGDEAHEFYNWLEYVMVHYKIFYKTAANGKNFQKNPSFDVSAAIVTKILGVEENITSKNSYPNFVHMKSHAQNWKYLYNDRWQDTVGVYQSKDLTLKIGNYKQKGIFHYTEKDFVTDEKIKIYENYLGI